MTHATRAAGWTIAAATLALACLDPSRDAPRSPPPTRAVAAPGAGASDHDDATRARIARRERAVADAPRDVALRYYLCSLYADEHEPRKALACLDELERMPFHFALDDAEFQGLRNDAGYADRSARFAARAAKVHKAEIALRIDERDLVPEGIAYDPASKAVFLGSIYHRKIVRIDAKGLATDFVPEGRDSLPSVLGMHVDPARKRLWVAANTDPGSHGYRAEDRAVSALYAFDLQTSALATRVAVGDSADAASRGDAPSPRHLLNDVAIAPDGAVFVTDSEAGALLVLRAGKNELETLVKGGTYIYPNGVAFEADRLYVAHALGIDRVDASTGATTPLAHDDGVVTAAVDGLAAYKGDLVGVVNGVGRPRVVRFHLDPSGARVERDEVLESESADFHIPTTAAVAGESLLVIANSSLDAIAPGRPVDPGRIAPPVILRVPL